MALPRNETLDISCNFESISQRIRARRNTRRRLAKRLRLGVAWANPLKRFEISVSLCKPKGAADATAW